MSRFVVAVTGGIASGKSEVCRRFAEFGIVIADADVFARQLVEPGLPALDAIVARFGTGVLLANGTLDRAALRNRVFDDPGARHDLESILHPRIHAALHDACDAAGSPYAIAAIPLLTERGGRTAYPWIDRILVVDASPMAQVDRLIRRDGSPRSLAERILAAQATRAQRLAIADDTVDNNGPPDAFASQVDDLHRRYLQMAGQSATSGQATP